MTVFLLSLAAFLVAYVYVPLVEIVGPDHEAESINGIGGILVCVLGLAAFSWIVFHFTPLWWVWILSAINAAVIIVEMLALVNLDAGILESLEDERGVLYWIARALLHYIPVIICMLEAISRIGH